MFQVIIKPTIYPDDQFRQGIQARTPRRRKCLINLRRWEYPYGIWTTAEGREILFNRYYEPIYQRNLQSNLHPTSADMNEWVKNIVSTRHFYNDQMAANTRPRSLITKLEHIKRAFMRGEAV
jgi:hypothetical protein